MHVDVAGLADRANHRRWSIGETTIIWALDQRDGRRDGAVKQVNGVHAVKLQPLSIVNRNAAGGVPRRV